MSQSEPLPRAADEWLAANLEGYRGPGTLTKFGFGQSNPTFRLTSPSGDYVLRRKPFGVLLPKAHAIEREFKALKGLAKSDVPVPRVHVLCEDATVLGAAFFVREFVTGRSFYDQRLPEQAPTERAAIFDAMNDAVAKLHRVDPTAVGLSDYGRPEGFVARQVDIWTKQYRASEGVPIPAMENLIAWLPQNLPPQLPPAIFHGDLRIDNMIFHATEPRVVAVLDWELSTLGDPIADFAYNCMFWRIGADLFRGFGGLDLPALGIPTEADYVKRYCARTGLSQLPHFDFYLAFSLFRMAAILQGIWRRVQDGNASAADAADIGAKAAPLAAIGWDIARGAS